MKSWKAVAGTLAMFMGISGAAMARDFDHDRDWKNGGAYGYQAHDRDDYAYNNGYRNYGYDNGYYRNNGYGRDGDHDRDDHGKRRNHDRDRDHDRDRHERGDRDRR